MAAGSAPYGDGFARLETDRLTVAFDGVRGVRRRRRRPAPRPSSRGRSAESISTSASGDGAAGYLASDLTYDYVRINAEYTT